MKKIKLLFFIFLCLLYSTVAFAGEVSSEQVARGIELMTLPVPSSIVHANSNPETLNSSVPPSAPEAVQQYDENQSTQLGSELPEADLFPNQQEGHDSPVEMVILRVSPDLVTFELHLASSSGKALSLEQWAQSQNLAIATNAGMFLPDGITNTGYMRYNEHINNGRIVKNFGAFFVASPKPEAKELKNAAILDRQIDAWENMLPNYGLVIQNYRLINEKGVPLWLPDGKSFSTSALAQDTEGRILFIFCAYPLNGYNFARAVLALPLKVTRLMYLEGGAPAALVLNTPFKHCIWNNSGVLSGFLPPSPIPNVLGVRIRK